jgi:hypothetical protein
MFLLAGPSVASPPSEYDSDSRAVREDAFPLMPPPVDLEFDAGILSDILPLMSEIRTATFSAIRLRSAIRAAESAEALALAHYRDARLAVHSAAAQYESQLRRRSAAWQLFLQVQGGEIVSVPGAGRARGRRGRSQCRVEHMDLDS